MPGWLQAGFWGWFSGSALLIGAAMGYWLTLSQRFIAAVMAFGSGVLISALSLELMEDAYNQGGFVSTAIGFLGGAVVFTVANQILSHYGAKHRKRSGHKKQPSEQEQNGSGLAIALGALLDGIPESVVIGLSLLAGKSVSVVAVAAVFMSNLPEGLSSAAGMKKSGRSLSYIFLVWGMIAFLSGVASFLGYSVFQNLSAETIAATTAVAAGAILSMIADTMIPEAFEATHNLTGLITVLGFLAAFFLSHY